LVYKKFSRVALKHSIHEPDPLAFELESFEDDDSDGSSGGLNKDEKIAIGVCVTLVFLVIVGLVLWWVCKKKSGQGQQGTAEQGKFSASPKNPQLFIPDVPALDHTDRTGQ